jgi:Sulfotransferase family
VETTQAAIISLLTAWSGQPRKALYQHSFPFSQKWGYLPNRDAPIITFEEQDIQWLCSEGVLEFVKDEKGRRCLVLTESQRIRALSRAVDPAIAAAGATPRREHTVAGQPEVQQIKRLLVGGGSTFPELEAAGKAGGGRVYHFDELLSLSPECPDPAPPLVFIHVPKTGGTTLNNILMKNFRYRLDSYGRSFFPRYFPDEFVSLVGPPGPDDTRRPVFFTGHVDIENDVLRYMPVSYVAITMLRDPIQRITSHYRGESTLPDSPIGDDIRSGKLTVLDFFRRLYPPYQLQHEIFAPQSHDIEEALHKLESISLFGLQERFDEFVLLLSELLGLPDVVHMPVNRTAVDAVAVTASQVDELRGLLAEETKFYALAEALYRERIAKIPAAFAARVESFQRDQQEYLSRRKESGHAWARFYA